MVGTQLRNVSDGRGHGPHISIGNYATSIETNWRQYDQDYARSGILVAHVLSATNSQIHFRRAANPLSSSLLRSFRCGGGPTDYYGNKNQRPWQNAGNS